MIELVRVHRDAKGSLIHLEPALERVWKMSHRFGGAPDVLVNDIWDRLAKKAPTLGFWVGLQDGALVGHLLAFVQTYDNRWVTWVTQTETDKPMTRAVHDQVMHTLEEFTHEFNFSFKGQGIVVEDIMMTTPHMSDAWARFAGFEPHRMLLRRPLHTKVA